MKCDASFLDTHENMEMCMHVHSEHSLTTYAFQLPFETYNNNVGNRLIIYAYYNL
jgi:hypothetical protein